MKIIDSGSITIGKNCEIYDYIIIATFGGDIKIGANSSINPFSVTYGNGSLNIGNCVRIAAHTVIITANHKFEDIEVPIHLQGETRVGITIEDDIWIGAGSKILDGVTIGKGSVIGLPPGAYSACPFSFSLHSLLPWEPDYGLQR